ncbi:MAG: hypothetical protein SXQ77_01590, partial [Halobacteria archaeon]|nr:hypothetical protein [Halobacteria archaeon]
MTMTDEPEYWFSDVSSDAGVEELADHIDSFSSDHQPADLPNLAIESGFVDTEDEYYDVLHDATLELARRRVEEAKEASDIDLVNAVRSLETLEENINVLDERVRDWREASSGEPSLLEKLEASKEELEETRDETEAFIEREAPEVAPNLSNLASPLLAARLIALAGGLEELARMPSSTVQVLGAEDALFRHL